MARPPVMSPRATWTAFALLMALQGFWGAWGIANYWQWGHHGFNGSAYQMAARNSLRWRTVFPIQYHNGTTRPRGGDVYTHAPLALHLHVTASVAVFGDREWAVRLVPALHGLLAACALFLVVRRRWGEVHAVMATTLYVLLPINHAFANMVNHSTGFIFWSLVLLDRYLAWREAIAEAKPAAFALAGFYGAAFLALSWDWPAYFVCFVVAVHAFIASAKRTATGRRRVFSWNAERTWLLVFSALVVGSFIGHFMLSRYAAGGLQEMQQSFVRRSMAPFKLGVRVAATSLREMFSIPIVAMTFVWLGWKVRRLWRGEAELRDLVPLAFLFAGSMQMTVFSMSAAFHVYWPWPLNPGIAIAVTEVLREGVRRVRARETPSPLGARWISIAAFGGFWAWMLFFTVPLAVEGRRMGGTYHYRNYDRDYLRVDFARQVRALTDDRTVVLIHNDFDARPEFITSLHRFSGYSPVIDPPPDPANSNRVLVAQLDRVPRADVLRTTGARPMRVYGRYVMVDLRRSGADLRAYRAVAAPAPWWWRVFVNSFDSPLRYERDRARELQLSRVSALAPATAPTPGR